MTSPSELSKDDAKFLIDTARQLARAVIDTVADVYPDPAPEGPMYAAWMAKGLSLHTFQKIMARLVEIEALVYIGNHEFILGKKFLAEKHLPEYPLHVLRRGKKEYSYGL